MAQQFLSEFTDGGPGCSRDDCSIRIVSGSVTLAYYPPTFDKLGMNTNRDRNITTSNKRCTSCGKSWTEQWQGDQRIN